MPQSFLALKKIPIFSGLNSQELKRLGNLARVHRAEKNQLIFQKQTVGSHLFVVLNGKIKIFSEMAIAGKKKAFAYLERGDFFGEMSLLDAKGRSLSAVALEDTELLTISRAEFQRLLTKDSKFMLKILQTLCDRLRHANDEIESLTFRSLYGRVCGKLLDLVQTNTVKNTKTPKTVNVTHNELAEFTGTAREMVTKVLSSLRKLNVIESEDRKITILSIPKLQELAQVNLEE